MHRDLFLARVAARLQRAAPNDHTPPPSPDVFCDEAGGRGGDRDRPGMIRLFRERLDELGGSVTLVPTREDAYASIAENLRARGVTTIACAATQGKALVGGVQVGDPRGAAFGLSEADWGIADTGTVVLRHRGEHGRGHSLVPPAAGFLLPVSRLVPHLGVVLAAVHEAASGPPACITFVTGPSHSGDIAGIFCAGVHGPGDVHVWLIDGE